MDDLPTQQALSQRHDPLASAHVNRPQPPSPQTVMDIRFSSSMLAEVDYGFGARGARFDAEGI